MVDFLDYASTNLGSGNVVNDVVLFCVIGALLSLLLALIVYRKGGGGASHYNINSMERVSSIGGRVEKLEMTLNEFRGETIRNLELFKGELGFVKQELREIRRLLGSSETPQGSTGDSGSGGFEIPGEEKFTRKMGDFQSRIFDTAPEPEKEEEIILPSARKVEDSSLKSGMQKTRVGFFQRVKALFGGRATLNADLADELEALMVSSDLGIGLSGKLIESLKAEIAAGKEPTESEVRDRLKEMMQELLVRDAGSAEIDPFRLKKEGRVDPLVILVVGINGVGKTTTAAKLAGLYKDKGAKVMLAAADTFRAAAVDQLREWGQRIDVPVVAGNPDAKPATVVFDAVVRAKAEGVDVLIIDTAGRLHTKSNLMQELEGVRNAVSRHISDGPHETVLVVDGTTGQNALSQAREFHAAVPLSGVIVTKLDGTPKGGIVAAIKSELNVPIRYIGIGEGRRDLKPFQAGEFVEAIFDLSSLEELSESNKLSEHGEMRRRRQGLPETNIVI